MNKTKYEIDISYKSEEPPKDLQVIVKTALEYLEKDGDIESFNLNVTRRWCRTCKKNAQYNEDAGDCSGCENYLNWEKSV